MAFLGPDGAGKSTIISLLRRHLRERGIRSHCFHWMVPLRRRVRMHAPQMVIHPHAHPPRGRLASLVKLAWLVGTAWPAWLRHVFPLRSHGHWVLIDRSFDDLLCDPRRYRYGGPDWAARLVARLVPQPDLTIVLYAPAEVIRSRKREVEEEELARMLAAYRRVGGCKSALLVDATPPPPSILRSVMTGLGMDESLRKVGT